MHSTITFCAGKLMRPCALKGGRSAMPSFRCPAFDLRRPIQIMHIARVYRALPLFNAHCLALGEIEFLRTQQNLSISASSATAFGNIIWNVKSARLECQTEGMRRLADMRGSSVWSYCCSTRDAIWASREHNCTNGIPVAAALCYKQQMCDTRTRRLKGSILICDAKKGTHTGSAGT